jgi:hypothetical protein
MLRGRLQCGATATTVDTVVAWMQHAMLRQQFQRNRGATACAKLPGSLHLPAAAAHSALASHQLQLTRPSQLHTARVVAAVRQRALRDQH